MVVEFQVVKKDETELQMRVDLSRSLFGFCTCQRQTCSKQINNSTTHQSAELRVSRLTRLGRNWDARALSFKIESFWWTLSHWAPTVELMFHD